MIFLNI